ncbi:MAG: hypothetical protein PHE21_03430, partial [Candidatus Dojkabacteria bacterium]|nr:hypothetical protein [Candidatus Dojkabacteria bacterium]
GKRFRISYDTKIFPTVTYLHYSEAETPVLGEMGSLFELGDVAGKEVYLEPFTAPYGNESGKKVTLDQGKYYAGFIMTAGSSGTVLEPATGPDGEYIKGASDNAVPINPDNPSQASYGYWRFVLFQATENPDGTTTLSLLGVNRGGEESIYIKESSLPEDMKGIINTNLEAEVFQMPTPEE